MRRPTTALFVGVLTLTALAAAQEPAPATPAPQSTPAPAVQKEESTSTGKKKKSLPEYVITGTVFNEKALAYPNVRVQIRRENEKKYRWEAYTNSRGEFAVRVPENQDYEVVVKEKHYTEVSRKVTAILGAMQEQLSIRLEAANQEKSGEKK